MVLKDFENEKEIYERKLIHNSIKRENFQRNSILLGLKKAKNNDLIIISDLDEIPNPKAISTATVSPSITLTIVQEYSNIPLFILPQNLLSLFLLSHRAEHHLLVLLHHKNHLLILMFLIQMVLG